MRAHHLQDTALRYFLEVVRSGSLAVASERLHVAASAISRQISGLEQALDTVLFERQPRGMVPTPAGEILAAHARRTSMDADRVLEDIDALRGARQGRVRIASAEGFASHFLPPLIVEFRRSHERMVFDVAVVAPAEVPARLRAGDADIGLTFSRTPEKDIRVEHQQPAPIQALMRPDHPLAAARSLTLARLCEYPVALPAPDTTLRQMIDIACSRQQIDLQPMLTCNTVAVLHGFVRNEGDAWTLALDALERFCCDEDVVVPDYSFSANRSVGTKRISRDGQRVVVAEGIFAAELIAPLRAEGLLADALLVRQNRWVTFARRLVRDLRESRKSRWYLVTQGWAKAKAEPAIVAAQRAKGARPVSKPQARTILTELAARPALTPTDA